MNPPAACVNFAVKSKVMSGRRQRYEKTSKRLRCAMLKPYEKGELNRKRELANRNEKTIVGQKDKHIISVHCANAFLACNA